MSRRDADPERALLAALLRAEGCSVLQASVGGAGPLEATVDGFRCSAALDGSALTLSTRVRSDRPWDLRAVNALNRSVRFARASVGPDGTLRLDAEHLVDLALGLGPAVGGWRVALHALRALAEDAVAAPPDLGGDLYGRDFHAWTVAQAAALRRDDPAGLDRANLLEEVEALGRAEAAKLGDAYGAICLQLLASREGLGVDHGALESGRGAIRTVLRDSPSLAARRAAELADAYGEARIEFASATGVAEASLPADAPFGPDEAEAEDYLPEPPRRGVGVSYRLTMEVESTLGGGNLYRADPVSGEPPLAFYEADGRLGYDGESGGHYLEAPDDAAARGYVRGLHGPGRGVRFEGGDDADDPEGGAGGGGPGR